MDVSPTTLLAWDTGSLSSDVGRAMSEYDSYGPGLGATNRVWTTECGVTGSGNCLGMGLGSFVTSVDVYDNTASFSAGTSALLPGER